MPRSPAGPARLSSYEDAWEAINRLIDEGGSWSGFERNCFYLNAGDGTFANASAASGLDFLDDGRAFAVLDLDSDGDPDLIVKNRSSPQVRVLRNDLPPRGGRVAFRLEGRRANRDAVGARVTLRSGGKVRTRSVTCGAGFLSQSSLELSFAFPGQERIEEIEVRWPGGGRQEFRGLPTGRRYRLREGETPVGEEFRPASRPEAAALPAAGALPGGEAVPSAGGDPGSREAWLLAELAPPAVAFPGAGRQVELTEFRGRELLLSFFSPRCTLCAAELRERAERKEEIRSSGLRVLLVQAEAGEEEGGAPGKVEEEARALSEASGGLFTLARATPRVLLAYGVLVHQALRWPKEIQVPLSILLDRQGGVKRLYRGPLRWETLARDLALLTQARDPLRLGLPFPGRFYTGEPRRDHFQLGIGYVEAGLPELGREAFQRALEVRPNDAEALFNLGLLLLGEPGGPAALPEAQALAEARRCLERALALHPDFGDARANLGVVLARSGDLAGAEAEFREALRLRPGHAQALLNLGSTLFQRGEPAQALEAFQSAARAEPQLPAPWKKLGETYRRLGRTGEALESLRAGLELDPRDAEARSNLGVILAEAGRLAEAAAELERAIRERPGYAVALNNLGLVRERQDQDAEARKCFRAALAADRSFAGPYLNLARSLLRSGDRQGAAEALRSLLAVEPGHREARELLQGIRDGR